MYIETHFCVLISSLSFAFLLIEETHAALLVLVLAASSQVIPYDGE